MHKMDIARAHRLFYKTAAIPAKLFQFYLVKRKFEIYKGKNRLTNFKFSFCINIEKMHKCAVMRPAGTAPAFNRL